jgi:hypothetical protein
MSFHVSRDTENKEDQDNEFYSDCRIEPSKSFVM